LGIRIMANLPARNDGLRRVDHLNQSGHFYLAERGHFYLAVTQVLRITGNMQEGLCATYPPSDSAAQRSADQKHLDLSALARLPAASLHRIA